MQVHLEYGRTGLTAELPDARVVKSLGYRSVAPLIDPTTTVRACLDAPISARPLAELARGRSSACVVICDITRPVPNEILLTPVLETLEVAGIPRDRIVILVATGLHRASTRDELVEMVGRRIAELYRIEDHHGRNRQEHVHLGESPRSVPIWIDRRYVDAELKITVGLIEPHFMAGFSGGRKLICPGIAAMETVGAWHSPRFLEHPNARNGCLQGNPVHEENTWIARRAGCDFTLNCAIDAKRQILGVFGGDLELALDEGIAFVRGIVRDTLAEPVDIVVTTAAGYPLDATFYQAIKGMVGALEIVRPGGTIVLAAALDEGIGSPEFQSLFDAHRTLEAFLQWATTSDEVAMDQWQLEELAKVRRKARVRVGAVTNFWRSGCVVPVGFPLGPV